MRRILLTAAMVLASACSESFEDRTNRRLDTTEPALDALRAELTALRMQVSSLTVVPDVMPIIDRVAALEARMSAMEASRPRRLHLIARNGMPDERDLGLGAPGSGQVFNEGFGASMDMTSTGSEVYFEFPDCAGSPLALASRTFAGFLFKNYEWKFYRANWPAENRRVLSMRAPGGCLPVDSESATHSIDFVTETPAYDPRADYTWQLR